MLIHLESKRLVHAACRHQESAQSTPRKKHLQFTVRRTLRLEPQELTRGKEELVDQTLRCIWEAGVSAE